MNYVLKGTGNYEGYKPYIASWFRDTDRPMHTSQITSALLCSSLQEAAMIIEEITADRHWFLHDHYEVLPIIDTRQM